MSLSQVGEFAFVLFAFMGTLGILSGEWLDVLMAATALSMAVTPVLMPLNERLILPRFGTRQANERPGDHVDVSNPGNHCRIQHIRQHRRQVSEGQRHRSRRSFTATPTQVDLLRKMGFRVFYGDATRIDMLHSWELMKPRF